MLPLVQRRSITNVPAPVSAGDGQRAIASAFDQAFDATGDVARAVGAKQAEDAAKDAQSDFAQAAISSDGKSAISLPSRESKFLFFRYQSEADEAYNQVARKLIIDQSINDFSSEISRVENDTALGQNPGAANSQLSQFASEYLKDVPAEDRENVELAFQQARDRTIQNISFKRQEADRKQSTDNSIRLISRNQQDAAVILEKNGLEALKSPEVQALLADAEANIGILENDPWSNLSSGWARDQREALADAVQVAGISGESRIAVEGAYLQGGVEAAQGAVQKLFDDFGEDIPQNVLDRAAASSLRWVADQEKDRANQIRESEKANRDAQTARYNEANRALADGDLTRERAQELFAKGQITDGQYTALYQQISARERRVSKDNDEVAQLHGGLLDPTDTKTRNIVDKAYRQAVKGGLDKAGTAEAYLREHSIFPKSYASELSAFVFNGNPDQRSAALDNIGALLEVNEFGVRKAFDSNVIRDAEIYKQTVLATGDADTGLSRVMKANEARNNPEFKSRVTEARKDASEAFSFNDLQGVFDDVHFPFTGEPEIEREGSPAITGSASVLRRAWEEEYSQALAETDNRGYAQDAADKAIQRVYGVTNATGSRTVIAHPPERFYQLEGTRPGYIQEQLLADVNSGFAEQFGSETPDLVTETGPIGVGQGKNIKASQISIVSDQVTARQASTGKPSYVVVVTDGNGVMHTIEKRWRPDVAAEQVLQSDIVERKLSELSERREQIAERQRKSAIRNQLMSDGLRAGEVPIR